MLMLLEERGGEEEMIGRLTTVSVNEVIELLLPIAAERFYVLSNALCLFEKEPFIKKEKNARGLSFLSMCRVWTATIRLI